MTKKKVNKKNLDFIVTIALIIVGAIIIGNAINAVNNPEYAESSASLNTEAGGFRINVGQQKFIKTSHSGAELITNNCNVDYFVPTRTKLEFDSFIKNRDNCFQRHSCYEEIFTVSNGQKCIPPGAIWNTFEEPHYAPLTNTKARVRYCLTNSSREVSSVFEAFDDKAYFERIKNEINKRISDAQKDIDSLENQFFVLKTLTDDGIPLKINSTIELLTSIKASYDANDINTYDIVLPILTELEELIVAVPYEGSSTYEVYAETTTHLALAQAKFDKLESDISGTYFTDSIWYDIYGSRSQKIDGIDDILSWATSDYNNGEFYMNAGDNNTAEDNLFSSLHNIDLVNDGITKVYADIISFTTSEIQSLRSDLSVLESDLAKAKDDYGSDLSTYWIDKSIQEIKSSLNTAENIINSQTNEERGINAFNIIDPLSKKITDTKGDLEDEIAIAKCKGDDAPDWCKSKK